MTMWRGDEPNSPVEGGIWGRDGTDRSRDKTDNELSNRVAVAASYRCSETVYRHEQLSDRNTNPWPFKVLENLNSMILSQTIELSTIKTNKHLCCT